MSLSLSIMYKDPARTETYHPFPFQRVARMYWWPLAKKLRLDTLARIESLIIEDCDEAGKLVRELRVVEDLLRTPGQADVPAEDAEYMLLRIGQVAPLIEAAIAEWDAVECLSL